MNSKPKKPCNHNVQARKAGKTNKNENRNCPGKVAEFVGCMGHPVKANKSQDELSDPAPDEDVFCLQIFQKEGPQRDKRPEDSYRI